MRRKLADAGFAADLAPTLRDAREAVKAADYSLVILDRRLTDGDGLSLIPQIRAAQPGVPIIAVTALEAVRDRITGFDQGVDDYIPKPFDPDELLARIRAVLRRARSSSAPAAQCGHLRFDPAERFFTVNGTALELRRREFMILEALILRCRRVVQRETLLNEAFGFDDDIQSNTLDAHVSRLRSRLAEAQAAVAIHTIRGVGYMLKEVDPA
jgi:DNA-binding response OmpR family regulator